MGAHEQPVSPYLRFLFGLPKGHIFTTRDLLPFARRTTIDTALSRMVRGGLLERLTRGVFRFHDAKNKKVTVKQIAAIKRKAFGRKIATVANNISRDCLSRLDDRGKELLKPSQETLATDGRTSSFIMHTNGWRINLKSVSPRLLALGESNAAKAMRDLWLIGSKDITLDDIEEVWQDLKPRDKAKIPALKKLLPQWLTEILPTTPTHVLEDLMIRPARKPIFIKPLKKPNSDGPENQSATDSKHDTKPVTPETDTRETRDSINISEANNNCDAPKELDAPGENAERAESPELPDNTEDTDSQPPELDDYDCH
ncbi:MAG: type IV toxin-antitoxin system AbiEi family antitoxin domain-containing protein [Candidatus Obscuribacter sp.]|nr:type IV toxin-antitoxin system AbiEi family antitoxin domain-containing protein [Candidatus Obscuribacter sp.]